jgi:hypothetical protein
MTSFNLARRIAICEKLSLGGMPKTSVSAFRFFAASRR